MTLSDDALIAAIESEEAQALDAYTGQLQEERSDALDRYRGLPLGNEVEGRSQIVDKSVLDTIEWIMPSLTRVFMGGDDIGQFEPVGPEDEKPAEQETEVCNWFLENKNDMFSHVGATLRDALLLKNGYMVGFWNKKYDTMVEEYVGKTDEEVAMLLQDPDVTVLEHNEYPAAYMNIDPQTGQPVPVTLHDVKVELKKCEEYVSVESVPPDEILVSRRHRWTSLLDADFVQWRRRVTIGQLRAEGFEVPDDLPGEEDFSQEWTERARYNENWTQDDTTPDPSRRYVVFKDTYIRIDLRGKGTPQLWRVCYVGGTKKPIYKKEAEIIPIAAFSPIIYPHSHVGMSVYDLLNDISLIMTQMTRQFVDSNALALNPRVATDVTRVNLDDLLTSRVGGVVRTEGNPSEILMPLMSVDVGSTALAGLEYMASVREQRTGVTRYSAGLDANSLNKTATGAQQIQAAANQRIELIARTLANGFRDLMLVVHTLAQTHSTQQLVIKLKGQWTPVNPREWKRRTDFKITVGLGSGTGEQQAQKLMMMGQAMPQLMGMGLAGPQEVYNLAAETWKALGYKHADKFVKPPQIGPDGKPQMPPPQPPESVQVEQMRQQGKQSEMQQSGQLEMQKMAMQAQAKEKEQQNNLIVQQQNDARDRQAQQEKAAMDAAQAERDHALKREQMLLQYQLDVKKHEDEMAFKREQMRVQDAREREAFGVNAHFEDRKTRVAENGASARGEGPGGMSDLLKAINSPKEIVRDKSGRAIGVRSVQ